MAASQPYFPQLSFDEADLVAHFLQAVVTCSILGSAGKDALHYQWDEGTLLQAVSLTVLALAANSLVFWLHQGMTGTAAADFHSACPVRLLSACVLAPLVEEHLFRGFLLTSLARDLSPPCAVALSSIAFAVIHPLTQFPYQLMLGCVLGTGFVACRGNLVVAFIAHSLYNLSILVS